MVGALDLGPEGHEFESSPVHPNCALQLHNGLSVSLENGGIRWYFYYEGSKLTLRKKGRSLPKILR